MRQSAPVTWVLCGGATSDAAPQDALKLSLGKSSESSMTVDIGGIERALTGRLDSTVADLVRIAAFVFGADGAVRRGNIDDVDDRKWCRRFRFVIGVRDASFWNQEEVLLALGETLGFLSQDAFEFEFHSVGDVAPQEQLMFSRDDGKPFLSWDHIESLCLFSGGLDSFAGAANLVLDQGRGALIVSHRSSSKMWNVQTGLVEELQTLAKEQGAPVPFQVAVEVRRHDARLRVERTLRTRSFFFAAIAGAAADLIGLDQVHMYENGIVGINLPVAGSVVGARGTRTVHPQVLGGFGKILSLVRGRALEVRNPFGLMTRPEIIQGLKGSPALHLAKQTISCAGVLKSSRMHPHCGVCSQCIDRRFGFMGAGMEEHDSPLGYQHDPVTDEWMCEASRRLLLSWVAAADDYAEASSPGAFLESFGEAARAVPYLMDSEGLSADEANRAVYELHKRHGQSVGRVIERVVADNSRAMRRGSLSRTTLPMLLTRQERDEQDLADGADEVPGPQNLMERIGDTWQVRFRSARFEVPDSRGFRCLSVLLVHPGEVYTAAALIAEVVGGTPPTGVQLDTSGVKTVEVRVRAMEVERDQAQEMTDESTASRIQAEINALKSLVANADARPPSPGERSLAKEVEKEVRKAMAEVRRQSKLLAEHLKDVLQVGSVYWYRRTAMSWVVSASSELDAAQDHEWVPASQLVDEDVHAIRDVREVRRFCANLKIPTKPGLTRDGRPHPRRLMVHQPSFMKALAKARREERVLQDAADLSVTERQRRAGRK